WDQEALERFWTRLHTAMPELGGDIEIIETANPRTYYEQTRRKLGMVMGVEGAAAMHRTVLPNVFMVGDTVSAIASLDSVVETARVAAGIQLGGRHPVAAPPFLTSAIRANGAATECRPYSRAVRVKM